MAEKDKKAGSGTVGIKDNGRVVVIGCSGAGALAAMTLKKMKSSVDVTVFREEDEKGLLTRCATPYICCGDVLVDPSYKDDRMFTDAGIHLVNERAESIDRKMKTVQTADGKDYSYDRLVLAAGAVPLIPPIEGADLDGVFTLRKSEDAFRILNRMNRERIKRCVIIGAGAIGIEIAYLTAKKGVDVEIVEMLDHILPRALDADMSREVESYIKAQGVDIRLNKSVAEINGNGSVDSVTIDSGEQIETGMVIISAGARPRIELAQEAGLDIGDLGVAVDRYLVTSDPDIYAAGDCIQFENYITRKPGLGQLRPNAVIGGRIAAKNILGRSVEYPPFVNGFATKFFDKSIAGTGLTAEAAEREGIQTVTSVRASADQHSMMREKKPYSVKLVFNKENGQVIGGQIVSDSRTMIKNIDTITVAIRSDWTASDLSTLRCAGQPELSPDPGKEPIALAAQEADALLNG